MVARSLIWIKPSLRAAPMLKPYLQGCCGRGSESGIPGYRRDTGPKQVLRGRLPRLQSAQ
jgi:hypothetical protein